MLPHTIKMNLPVPSVCFKTDLWGADTNVAVQEVMPDFKLITSTVENVL